MGMHEDFEEFENAQDDLADVKRQLAEFWEQDGADEMEDTYGELMEEHDRLEERLRELRQFGAFY